MKSILLKNQLFPKLSRLKPYLLLLVVVLLAYLPVSSFYFGMKNDAFSDNFPNKFFLSQSIHSGFLPLWNPYLNFGFPIYADPGFAFWNPITWLFGCIGYSAYTLTTEVLLYIYLAGVTMYRLGKFLGYASYIAFAIAAMYMCSGFFYGELQHINFLTAAAFLPLTLKELIRLFQNPDIKNAGLFAFALYMVFAGGHPAMPVATIYFLMILTVCMFSFSKEMRQNFLVILPYFLLSVVIFLLLFSPAIYSYANIINQYGRSHAINQYNETNLGFSPSSYLSFLFPFATVKDARFLTDDPAMRNAYFSLAGVALLITVLKSSSYLLRSLLIAGICMLILSSGGAIKALLYSHLPALQFIRTNGEYRIFGILGFCVLAGEGLRQWQLAGTGFFYFRKIIKVLLLMSSTIFFMGLIKGFGHLLQLLSNTTLSVTEIKFFVDSLTFADTLLISAALNIVLIIFLLLAKNNTKKIAVIIVVDLMINSIAYLPFSGVGTVKLSAIQSKYDENEKGIPKPLLLSINNIDTFSSKQTGLLGSASFYNKKIGIMHLTDYPSWFTNTETYFKSSATDTINHLPYIFLKTDIVHFVGDAKSVANVTVDYFSPTVMRFLVDVNAGEDSLILLQNNYKYWKAKVDERPIIVQNAFITFMSVPVQKGQHVVTFYYQDKWLLFFVLISSVTFLVVVWLICRKPKSMSKTSIVDVNIK